MGADNLKPFLQERIKVNGRAGSLGGGVVTIERSKSKFTVTFEVSFPVKVFEISYQKIVEEEEYCLHEVAKSKESY